MFAMSKMPVVRATRPVTRAVLIEMLEQRKLLSIAAYDVSQPSIAQAMQWSGITADGATPQAVQPKITGSNPANGETNVPRYSPISLKVQLAVSGSGIDPATLNTDNVHINRASDNQFVNVRINADAGGAAITIQPNALLAANTAYKITVGSGLKDTSGNAFAPFSATFTTGEQVPAQDPRIVFAKANQSAGAGKEYASLAWGPDNKLYAGTLKGEIVRFTVGSDGTLSSPQTITTVNTSNGQTRFIIGMAFDSAGNLWVSHSQATNLEIAEAADWTGKISVLSGSNYQNYADVVVGLPRSVRDHLTNQIHFGPDGALYWSQPSMNAMGAPDTAWVRRDHPLSGAVLRLDTSKYTGTPIDVKTPDGGGSYDPNASGAPVTVYATGVRNAYDFVFHSNGHLYMPANGSAAGGDTLAGPGGNPPAMTNVQETMHDYVFDIKKGGYYGQPNETRGELILNGGNPTSGVDPNEVVSYPVGTQPEANYRGSAMDFGMNYAPTGTLEYKSNTFGGALKGRLLVTRYSGGDDIFILTPSKTGNTLSGINGVNMDGFNDPTDIVEDPNTGRLYVAQLGTEKSGSPRNLITLLTPTTVPTLTKLQLINADAGYSLGALGAKSTFNLPDKPTRNLSIKALFDFSPGSVKFDIDGVEQMESSAPFALKGNNPDGSYIPWTPTVGMHTLTVTPYTGANGTGVAGATSQLVFWVTDQTRPFAANINFQPVDTPYVKGYKPDWGRLYALRGNGLTYGWNKATYNFVYDNNNPASPDQRFDTGVKPGGRKWDIAVPNGTYSVFLLGGDLNDPNGTYNVAVEGVPTLVGTTTAKSPWIGKTVQVTVADNTLSVYPLAGNVNQKLSFIQIVST
jgi:glucose/arabinose dehydrogenase